MTRRLFSYQRIDTINWTIPSIGQSMWKYFGHLRQNFGVIERVIAFFAAVVGLIIAVQQIASGSNYTDQDSMPRLSGTIIESSITGRVTKMQLEMNIELSPIRDVWVCSGKIIIPGHISEKNGKMMSIVFSDFRGNGIWTVRLNHIDDTTTSFEVDLYGNELKNIQNVPEIITCE